jgi:Co/Zn/Cd efflux system component
MFISLILTLGLVTFQAFVVRQTGSLAISAYAVHYKADVLTNIAILGAIFASSYWQLHILDPLLGLVVVVLILLAVRVIVINAIDVLLDRELPEEDRQRIATSFPPIRVSKVCTICELVPPELPVSFSSIWSWIRISVSSMLMRSAMPSRRMYGVGIRVPRC